MEANRSDDPWSLDAEVRSYWWGLSPSESDLRRTLATVASMGYFDAMSAACSAGFMYAVGLAYRRRLGRPWPHRGTSPWRCPRVCLDFMAEVRDRCYEEHVLPAGFAQAMRNLRQENLPDGDAAHTVTTSCASPPVLGKPAC